MIATTTDRGLVAAQALRAAGVEIVAVCDLRPEVNELGPSCDAPGCRCSPGTR